MNRIHPTEEELFDFTQGDMTPIQKHGIELHLSQCSKCSEVVNTIEMMETELREAITPPIPEGFALRVSQEVKSRDAQRTLGGRPFVIFRWAILAAVVLVFFSFLLNLDQVQVSLEQITIQGGTYYFMTGICLAIIVLIDRGLGRFVRNL